MRKKYWFYCIPVLLALVPLLWFLGRPGVLITGSDTNFPLNPGLWFHRRFFVWQNILNLGGDFSSSTAGAFFHLLQFIPFKLNLALQTVEILNLVFWFSLIIVGSFILARALFHKKRVVQIIFIILYCFNIYIFNVFENVKVSNLALVASLPLGLWLLTSLRHGKIRRSTALLLSPVVGIILSGSGINPAYLVCFMLVLVIFVIAEVIVDFGKWRVLQARIADLILILIPILLVNSFWILPTVNFIFTNIASSNSIASLGYSNWINSLSGNTSILNVLRMQGAWDWYSFDSASKLPLYIPYALKYFQNPFFIAFSFIVPSIAFFAYVVRALTKKKENGYLYVFCAITLTCGLFLSAGTHAPTGMLFDFFATHVPFFTLFRSPWYIFGQMIGVSLAILVALFFYNIYELVKNKQVVGIVGSVLIVCSLVYAYPLVLGRIFRPNFDGSFYITFPDYVFQSGDWLNNSNFPGRILSYPDDTIERFKWGYGAIGSILNLMSDKEVVDFSAGDNSTPLVKITGELYTSIKNNQIQKAKNLAHILGIGQIFDKRDEISLVPALPPEITKNKLAGFGEWNFYGLLNKDEVLPKIYSANCCVFSYPYDQSFANAALLPDRQVLVNPQDSVVGSKSSGFDESYIIKAKNSQIEAFNNGVSDVDFGSVTYLFTIPQTGQYQPVLERIELDKFKINPNKVLVSVDGKVTTLTEDTSDDSFVYFQKIDFNVGDHTLVIDTLGGNNLASDRYSKEGIAGVEESDGEISIFNNSPEKAGVVSAVSLFDPRMLYSVSLEYKQVYGTSANVVASQQNKTISLKNDSHVLPNYPEWRTVSFNYSPIVTDSTLEIKLLAPGASNNLETRVLYKNLSVHEFFGNNLFFRDVNSSKSSSVLTFKENSPVSYDGKTSGFKDGEIIVFNENYSPLWHLQVNKNEAKILHFTANSYANAWLIENAGESFDFTISYQPQNTLNLGYAIASATVLGLMLYFCYTKRIK